MNKLNIRPATLKDLPILYQFEQGIISAERPFDETLKPDPINYYDIGALIESNESEVVVAVIDDRIVGSAYAKIKKAKHYLNHTDYVYLGFMYVDPAYRGRGINMKIIENLKKWTRSKNLTELRLDVYDGNIAAIKAYEKAGFDKHLVNMRLGV